MERGIPEGSKVNKEGAMAILIRLKKPKHVHA